MSDETILSQQEVNALLQAVNTGKVRTDTAPDSAEDSARPCDLTNHDRIIRGRMPTLDVLNERLARSLRAALFNLVRRTVTVNMVKTELEKFAEFVARLSSPPCLNLFRMPPLRAISMVAVDADLVFGLVDQLLGGHGEWYRAEGREYSAIEMRMIRHLTGIFLDMLKRAWAPVVAIQPEFLRTEANPQFAGIAAPTDVVIAVTYEVAVESAGKGTIVLVVPYAAIEPIRPQLSSAIQTETGESDNAWRALIGHALRSSTVNLRVIFGKGHLAVGELAHLKHGDVIRLDADGAKPLVCKVQGVDKVWGTAVVSRGHMAFKLLAPLGVEPPRANNNGNKGAPHERNQPQAGPAPAGGAGPVQNVA